MAGKYENYQIPEIGYQRLAGMIIGTPFNFCIGKEQTEDINDTKELTAPLRANTAYSSHRDIDVVSIIIDDMNMSGNDFAVFKDIKVTSKTTGIKKKKMFFQTKKCRSMNKLYHVAYRIAKHYNTMKSEERISQKTLTKAFLNGFDVYGLATWLMFALNCKGMTLSVRGEHTAQCRKNLYDYMSKVIGIDNDSFSVEINPKGGTVVKFKNKDAVKYLINYCKDGFCGDYENKLLNELNLRTRLQGSLDL